MFDKFIIKDLAYELNKILVGLHFQKIWGININTFQVKIKSNIYLIFSADSKSAHISIHEQKNNNTSFTSSLLTSLKKHLENAKIISIQQLNDDRIIEIFLSGKNEILEETNYHLILEFMGRHSNIILLDGERKIINSLKFTPYDSESERIIRNSYKYIEPDKNNISLETISKDNLTSYDGFYKKLISILPKDILSLSPTQIYDWLNSQKEYCIYIDKVNNYIDFHKFNNDNFDTIKFDCIFDMINEFYKGLEKSNFDLKKYLSLIKSKIKKLKNKKTKIKKDIERTSNIDKFKKYGELIFANAYKLKGNKDSVILFDYYENKDIKIPLDSKLTITQNAKKFYKRANKLSRSVLHLNNELKKIDLELNDLLQLSYDIENISSKEEFDLCMEALDNMKILKQNKTTKKANIEPYFIKYEYNNSVYKVGKNSISNEKLRASISNKHHIWFHVKDVPGSHVILEKTLEDAKDDDIVFGAKLAAYYSKSKNSSNVMVDYTKLKYVKKIRGAKSGLVTYTNQSSIFVTPNINELIEYLIK